MTNGDDGLTSPATTLVALVIFPATVLVTLDMVALIVFPVTVLVTLDMVALDILFPATVLVAFIGLLSQLTRVTIERPAHTRINQRSVLAVAITM